MVGVSVLHTPASSFPAPSAADRRASQSRCPGGWFIPIDNGLLPGSGRPRQVIPQQSPAVDILMAVNAEVFPVAAIGRVVLVIAVLVVNGQQMTIGGGKFPAAATADHAVQGKRSFSIIPFAGELRRLDLPNNFLSRSRRSGPVLNRVTRTRPPLLP